MSASVGQFSSPRNDPLSIYAIVEFGTDSVHGCNAFSMHESRVPNGCIYFTEMTVS